MALVSSKASMARLTGVHGNVAKNMDLVIRVPQTGHSRDSTLTASHLSGEMPDKKKGLIFSGQWVAGKRHGFGIQLDLKTADVFAGQWEYGLKHGVGIMRQKHLSLGDVRIRMEWNRVSRMPHMLIAMKI